MYTWSKSGPEQVSLQITHSSGNHGQAVAWAARAAGVGCTVVVPDGAPEAKVSSSFLFYRARCRTIRWVSPLDEMKCG